MLTKTPKKISKAILELCKSINPNSEPKYIPVNPVKGSTTNDCFMNIKKQLAHNEGDAQYGWVIWEWPNVMIEAESYTVWKNSDGNYISITPTFNGEKEILFLLDESSGSKGRGIKNISRVLKDDPLIQELLNINDRIFDLVKEYSRIGCFSEIYVPKQEILPLQRRKQQILARLKFRPKIERNSLCPCGSGKKYKKCCGG